MLRITSNKYRIKSSDLLSMYKRLVNQ